MTEDSKIPAPLLEKPHHLFRPEKDYSKMMVVPETVELLKQIKTPVVIVTIVGTQRGGKSTLLNLLHSRKTAGFGLGHFMDPCTTGLWIWCRPHPRDPDLTVILMDTEGLDSPHVPQWYNWTLSALALLISTYFIYQTKGSIDSNATDRLGVILKVAEQLRGGIDDKTDKPEFLWLIRDHQLAMKKAPKSEMTDKLDGGSLKALQRCFSDYDCVPLPRPVDKDELLKEVEKLSWDELRSEFREEYVVLERSIFNLIARPRSLSGRPITGDVIASLVSKYAASISGKDGILTSLSQLPTQRQMVVKLAGERAVTVAFQEYANKINELLKDKFPVSDTGLAEAHQKAYEESLKIFQNEANIEDMKNLDADLEEYLAQYNKHINDWQLISTVLDGECVMVQKLVGGYYYQIWKKNIDVSKKHCHDELAALYSPLSQKVKQADFPSIQDFYKEVEAVKSTYRSSDKATGSAKQLVQVEFFESKISSDAEVVSEALMRKEFTTKDESLKSELIKHFQDAIKQQEEAFKQQLQTQATQYEAKLESLSNSLKQAAEDTNKSFAAQKNATEELGKQLGEKISTINDKIHQIEVPVALHTQQLQTVGTSVEAIQTELKGLPQLQTRVETLDVKFSSKIEQNEKNIADVDKKIDAKSEDLKQAISSHVNDTTSKLSASETSLKEKLEAANTTHQSAQSQLQQSLSQQADQIKTTATQLEAEKEKIKSLEQQLQQTSSQTNQKVEEVGQSLKDLVAESSKKLDEKVAHSTTESKTQLEAVKSTIETNVSSIQQQLQTQLNEHQQSIQQYRTTSTSEMATLTQSLKQQSDHVLTTTTTQVDEAVSRVRLELSNGLKISEEKTTQLVAELKTALETRSDSLKQDTESKVTSITTELSSWKQTAQSQNDAILSQLSQLTEQAKKDIAGLSQQYEEKINSLVQQTQSMASSSTQAAAFQQAIEERARLLENVANELKSQYQSLITSTNSSQEQLRSENQKLTSTVQHLSSQLDSLAQVNTALKSLEADFQKKVAEIALNQEQLGSNYKVKIDEGIRSLTTRCAANEQLIDAFRKNLEQLQTSLVSSKQLADTVSQVDQKLNGLQAELKKMRDVSTAANEASKSVDHLKHSLDAIWESIGVLSGRIVNVEALVDKNN